MLPLLLLLLLLLLLPRFGRRSPADAVLVQQSPSLLPSSASSANILVKVCRNLLGRVSKAQAMLVVVGEYEGPEHRLLFRVVFDTIAQTLH